MDATGVNHTSVARRNVTKRNMKLGFSPALPLPNIGMNSASNKFKPSGNLAEWCEFIDFRAEKMKSDDFGSENEKKCTISKRRRAVLRMAETVPPRTM